MTKQCVAVEGDLGVEALQVTLLGDDQRVDFQHLHILREEGGIELAGDVVGLLSKLAGKAKRLGDGEAVMGHEAGCRIDREGDDLFGRVVCDLLDIHAAFGGDDKRNPRGNAVDEDRQVEFLFDVGPVFDVQTVDLLARFARLDGDQRGAKHLLGEGLYFVDGRGKTHAAFFAGGGFLELALTAAASMDL